jgi:transcriptional regulator with XRE-family HTH domain
MSSEQEFRAALDKHIGRRITDRRKKMQLSLSELDNAMSASPGTSSRLEHAATMVDSVRLVALSRVLDVTVSYFFEGFEAPPVGTPFPSPGPEDQAELEAFLEAF